MLTVPADDVVEHALGDVFAEKPIRFGLSAERIHEADGDDGAVGISCFSGMEGCVAFVRGRRDIRSGFGEGTVGVDG